MRASWLMRLFPVLLLLLSFSAWAAPQAEQYGSKGTCPAENASSVYTPVKKDTYGAGFLSSGSERWGCNVTQKSDGQTSFSHYTGTITTCVLSAMSKDNSCQCDTSTGAYYVSSANACGCPAGKEMNLWKKQCVAPCASGETRGDPQGDCYPPCPDGQQRGATGVCPSPICNSPKIEQNGSCVCPTGTVASGETCITPPPDCSQKQGECSTSCGGTSGSMSNVAYFYCETSAESDPSTQLFSGVSYKCECNQQGACPSGKVQVYATDGTASCGDSKNPGCPQGSYYGEFSGQTGCIAPPSHNDPDETPNNCMTGTNPVYYGSTLYCVPQPDSTTCPTGTTSLVTDTGLKICKRTDSQGNSTGDSPDTNGYIKGTSTSGSGTGTGDGTGSGSGTSAATGTYDAAISAKLSGIKANTDSIKASAALTTANTQATANNTADIKKNTDDINKALTGTMPTTTKGSFTDSIAQLTTETDQLKTDLSTKFDQIKANLYQRFTSSGSPTGNGSLPCFEGFTFLNQNIQFCFTQFNDKLQIIGQFIVGFGFLLAAFIVLRKD